METFVQSLGVCMAKWNGWKASDTRRKTALHDPSQWKKFTLAVFKKQCPEQDPLNSKELATCLQELAAVAKTPPSTLRYWMKGHHLTQLDPTVYVNALWYGVQQALGSPWKNNPPKVAGKKGQSSTAPSNPYTKTKPPPLPELRTYLTLQLQAPSTTNVEESSSFAKDSKKGEISRKFLKTLNTAIVSADTTAQLVYITDQKKVLTISGINIANTQETQEVVTGWTINTSNQDKKTLHCRLLVKHHKGTQDICDQVNTKMEGAGFVRVQCEKARVQDAKPTVSGFFAFSISYSANLRDLTKSIDQAIIDHKRQDTPQFHLENRQIEREKQQTNANGQFVRRQTTGFELTAIHCDRTVAY